MANTIVRAITRPGETLTLKLYDSADLATVDNGSGDSMTEAAADGIYTATVTEALTGLFYATVENAGGVIGSGWVVLADDTDTYDIVSTIAEAQAGTGGATEAKQDTILSKLLKYTQLIVRKDAAIKTDNATELTAINADGGSGAGAYDSATESLEGAADTIKGRLGAWTGSGDNTVLGGIKAIASKAANTPSDIGGTFSPANDSIEAIRDRGDAAWSVSGQYIASGTLQSATATTAVLAASTSLGNDVLNDRAIIWITGGTGSGQSRLITDWVSSTDTATVDAAWTTNPDATSTYVVTPVQKMAASSSSSDNSLLLTTTIATVTSQTVVTLTAGVQTDDYYNGKWVTITDAGSTVTRFGARVSDYVGSTRTLTLDATPGFTIAVGDTVAIESTPVFVSTTDGVITNSLSTGALASLASSEIEVISVFSAGGGINLIKGDDYINDELTFTETASEDWPTLTDHVVTFEAIGTGDDQDTPTGDTIDITGTVVTATGSSKVVKFNTMTRTVTAIAAGTYNYHIIATDDSGGASDGTRRTLRYGPGKLIIHEDYAVPDA
jgi:hypothetical protein